MMSGLLIGLVLVQNDVGLEEKRLATVPGTQETMGTPVFSRDGRQVAVVSYDAPSADSLVLLNGKEHARYRISPRGLTFCPDGKGVAYFYKKEGWHFAINGRTEDIDREPYQPTVISAGTVSAMPTVSDTTLTWSTASKNA